MIFPHWGPKEPARGEMQSRDGAVNQVCFEQWKSMPSSVAKDLSWDDVQLALTWFRTRCYGTDTGVTLIPGSDLFNSARGSDINTRWHGDSTGFRVSLADAVQAGSEMFETYCYKCDNSKMLKIWGVYLEDNPNQVSMHEVDCDDAQKHSRLRQAMEQTLDLSAKSVIGRSPRCLKSEFK